MVNEQYISTTFCISNTKINRALFEINEKTNNIYLYPSNFIILSIENDNFVGSFEENLNIDFFKHTNHNIFSMWCSKNKKWIGVKNEKMCLVENRFIFRIIEENPFKICDEIPLMKLKPISPFDFLFHHRIIAVKPFKICKDKTSPIKYKCIYNNNIKLDTPKKLLRFMNLLTNYNPNFEYYYCIQVTINNNIIDLFRETCDDIITEQKIEELYNFKIKIIKHVFDKYFDNVSVDLIKVYR